MKDQVRNVQLEKMAVEDSLCRLQVLKSLDEAQLTKLHAELDQVGHKFCFTLYPTFLETSTCFFFT